jgi:diphthamide synthase subunit DPH2
MQLELNLSELKKEIKPSDKNIFIQLPEGLKTKISELKKAFPKSNLFFQ